MTATTTTTILTLDERRAFEAAWRAKHAAGTADASDLILQALLRERDPMKGFTPISRPTKLANGCTAWQGYQHARALLRHQLGARLHALMPELMGQGMGPTRYEDLLKALAERIAAQPTEA